VLSVESGGSDNKLAHQPRVFDSGRALHARGDVDDVGSEGSYGAHDVVRLQSACQHDRGAPPVARKIDGEITPRKRLARAAKALFAPCVQNDRVCSIEQNLRVGWDVRACNSDRGPDLTAKSASDRTHIRSRGICLELDD